MTESPYGPPLRRQSTMLRRYLFGTFRAISCDKLSYLVFPLGSIIPVLTLAVRENSRFARRNFCYV